MNEPLKPLWIVTLATAAQAALNAFMSPSYFLKFIEHRNEYGPFVGPPELPKPDDCPCCGGEAKFFSGTRVVGVRRGTQCAAVVCEGCGLGTREYYHDGGRSRALEAWNRRTNDEW